MGEEEVGYVERKRWRRKDEACDGGGRRWRKKRGGGREGARNAIRDLPPVTHFPLLEPITYFLECSKTVLPLGDQVLRHE